MGAGVVNQDHRNLEDGKDDVTGGVQEVTGVEGTVLSLDLEVVDLSQEVLNSWDGGPGSAFVRVHRRAKILTIGLAESTEQVDSAVDEALELSKDLAIDHDIASLNWFIHVETGEDLTVFEEEIVGLCCDKRGRDVAGEEVLQPLNPGGEVLDVFI